MIFLSAFFRLVASEDRSRMNLLVDARWRDSDSCSKSKSWEAMLGPVMMKADGILSPLQIHPLASHPSSSHLNLVKGRSSVKKRYTPRGRGI